MSQPFTEIKYEKITYIVSVIVQYHDYGTCEVCHHMTAEKWQCRVCGRRTCEACSNPLPPPVSIGALARVAFRPVCDNCVGLPREVQDATEKLRAELNR